jgi:hypothetical protein
MMNTDNGNSINSMRNNSVKNTETILGLNSISLLYAEQSRTKHLAANLGGFNKFCCLSKLLVKK